MRKKNFMTALAAAFCLTASALAPGAAVLAEEETAQETDAQEETSQETAEETTEETGETGETGGTGETGEASETEAVPERPDYNALDYVTLGEYTGLTVTVDLTVSEEEVQQEIESSIRLSGELENVEDGVVEEGDTVNIDYEGKLDGEAFEGGTDKGYDLEIGSNTFIDGFEEGLIGTAKGETVDLPLTFPENYFSEDLAGQDVVFTVTVNEIQRVPELTDELASTLSEGAYTDAASYQDSVRQELESQRAQQRDAMASQEILTQIAASSTIESYPQEMVDYSVESTMSYYESMAEAYGMEMEEFLTAYMGLTEEELREQAALAASQSMQTELYLKAIAEQEGIEVTEEEFQSGAQEYADQYGFESTDALMDYYGEGTVRISLLQDKVMDFLMENTTVEEVTQEESESAGEAETEAASEETQDAE